LVALEKYRCGAVVRGLDFEPGIESYAAVLGNLPVNWPKLVRLFQNGLTKYFDMYVFGMSFYIIFDTNK